jgi:hypothetical protein
MVEGPVGNSRLVIQFLTLREPRNEITIREFVVSVATKPVASVLSVLGFVSGLLREMMRTRKQTHFSNSVSVLVLAASILAQLPCGQVIFVFGELLLSRQYAAALY